MTTKIKTCCPECGKYIMATKKENGAITCQCPNCKVVFYSIYKDKERLIKIKYDKK